MDGDVTGQKTKLKGFECSHLTIWMVMYPGSLLTAIVFKYCAFLSRLGLQQRQNAEYNNLIWKNWETSQIGSQFSVFCARERIKISKCHSIWERLKIFKTTCVSQCSPAICSSNQCEGTSHPCLGNFMIITKLRSFIERTGMEKYL